MRPSVGRVRPGYSHAFSPAPAPVGRLQTGYREPSQAPRSVQRVRQPTAGSVARFRRMIENPGLKRGELSGIIEKEALEMQLWIEDYKQKSLRMEIDKKKLEQQIKDLEDFQGRHPEAEEAPSPFEVFCELNPADEKCRVYDD